MLRAEYSGQICAFRQSFAELRDLFEGKGKAERRQVFGTMNTRLPEGQNQTPRYKINRPLLQNQSTAKSLTAATIDFGACQPAG